MSAPLYAFNFTLLDGSPAKLQDYAGKVILVVNTASQCGYTPQYAGLEALYRRYRDRGLVVIGFPCNQFGRQEPGSDAEIGAFCQKNYGVSFPMASKVDVNGTTAHPLWHHLVRAKPGLLGTLRIKWNFTKFLIDRQGHIVARHSALTKPEALASKIEALL
ncbi:glutathione peroxidase [Pseudogulbenkiania subflava]|uniref:Glutathione peroxidase n=1 Tax=Pseudogulbenkiania subflava DSM 22618 TaxID=1123014 RepID=A0A1Y6C1C4_9NEIS|nr:glutathione peroxidase [Pseudogulbenkiania subflava]SMF31203.1 glutathione peroxidase [Pseudogulbenkiania subflava DSM 22618]